MLKHILEKIVPNPFETFLKKIVHENKSRFLILWNRGLGDIPLGLYGLVFRIRQLIPHASITFLTRVDLQEAFTMLDGIKVLACPGWKRGEEIDVNQALDGHNLTANMFDVILEKPDPTRWVKWQLGVLTPKLVWNTRWDSLCDSFDLDPDRHYIGVHVQTETDQYYGYQKNWDLRAFKELFQTITFDKKGEILLFGHKPFPPFLMDGVHDLRGKTSLLEMLSIIKNRCRYLLVPDSGVLSIIYYLDVHFPLKLVSLWADPKQGVLKQGVESPNQQLIHQPLVGKDEDISSIGQSQVYQALFN